MTKYASAAALPGDVLTVQPYSAGTGGGKSGKAGVRTFLVEVKDEAASKVLLVSLLLLHLLALEHRFVPR